MNNQIDKIRIELPQSLEAIEVPVQVGPSSFPNNIDQLKTIDYSAVPNDSVLEAKLMRYYQLLSLISSNQATEKDLSELQRIVLDVRNYVLTEEDFNLMADAVRTTQIYLKNAADANVNNYQAISTALFDLSEEINEWTRSFNNTLDIVGQIPSLSSDIDYSFGPNQPTKAPENYEATEYYWVKTYKEDGAEKYELNKSVVNEDKTFAGFSPVVLNSGEKQDMELFTKASDIFKRKTVICTKDDFQSDQTTSPQSSTIDTSLADMTNQTDLVLEELSIGNNSGEVSNVDDLIDGHFEYGLEPIDLVDSYTEGKVRTTYPEDAEYNHQGGDY